jgi:uncharacterized alpha-E superfamily protein
MLLDLCDSQIVYRSRYLAEPMRNPVFDLVLLDPANPRSLKYQIREIVGHLEALPSVRDDDMPEQPLREGYALQGILASAIAPELDSAVLADVQARLFSLSDAISVRYFLQFEKTDEGTSSTLLG